MPLIDRLVHLADRAKQSLGDEPYLRQCGTKPEEWREITDSVELHVWVNFSWNWCGDDPSGPVTYKVVVEYIDGRKEQFGETINYPDYSFDADQMTDADWAALRQQHYHEVTTIDLRGLAPVPLP